MIDAHYLLMAGITAIGFIGAIPPRLLVSHLKSLRSGTTAGDTLAGHPRNGGRIEESRSRS